MSDPVDSKLGDAQPTASIVPSELADSSARSGKIRPMILMWALGIPIPILILIFLFRGCM